jgi:hypothetical protein
MTGPAIKSTYTPEERTSFNKTVNHIWEQLKPEKTNIMNIEFNHFQTLELDDEHLITYNYGKVIFGKKRFEVKSISIFQCEIKTKEHRTLIERYYQPNVFNEKTLKCEEAHAKMTEEQLLDWIEELTEKEYTI